MIDTSKDGGPAFPQDLRDANGTGFQYYGMTLRDYFAAKALAGMLADPKLMGRPQEFAERSYALADAMILERAK